MLIVFSLLTSGLFALLAIIFSHREQRITQELKRKNKKLAQRLYEANLLESINERMGYALNISDIAENVAVTIEDIFELSTVSYAVIEENEVRVRVFKKEDVSDSYVEAIKRIMLTAIYSIENDYQLLKVNANTYSTTKMTGSNALDMVMPKSYFNVPIVVGDSLRGVITISSYKPNLYLEEDMSILYKIINKVTNALSQLEEVVAIEKTKTESLISNLSSGAILLMNTAGGYILSTINDAARRFLLLEGRVEAKGIMAAFKSGIDLETVIHKAQEENREQVIDNVKLNGRIFKVFINPVSGKTNNIAIGAAITMQDVTIEKDLVTMRENFTNMVVHELRTPLTSIKGAVGLLEKGEISDEERRKLTSNIYRSSSRLLQDVSDLLDASKIDAGKFTIIPEKANLNELIREEADELRGLAEEKHIELRVELDERITPFAFDSERMKQVVSNLLSNSIKFTRENGEIVVGNAKKDDIVEVFVKDNGVGIEKDKIDLLFSKYQQASREQRGAGTGLGLFISKGIVQSHGGKIWIESEKEKGTVVRFTLPIVGVSKETVVKGEESVSFPGYQLYN